MKYTGIIHKMKSKFVNPIQYYLPIGKELLSMNQFIGKNIKLEFLNKIVCSGCGAITKKSFAQGYCYKCFISHPETSPCILKPELCEAHKGISRDMEWSKHHCLTNHIVYLAVSSGIKVGITRESQVPTRWIDQGASYAIKIARTPNRYTAGRIEVALKQHFKDKTNWRKMLKNEIDNTIDLELEKSNAWEVIEDDLKAYFIEDDEIVRIEYPVLEYPLKVNSQTFDKQKLIEGKVKGMKGQYLIFENNSVLNIRKHNSYEVSITY